MDLETRTEITEEISLKKKRLLSRVSNYNIYWPMSAKNRELSRNFLENKNMSEEELDFAIEKSILKTAKEDYKLLLRGRDIEHDLNPAILFYGMKKKVFSFLTRLKIKRMKFDHGNTYESLFKTYHQENLPSIIREKMLSESTPWMSYIICSDDGPCTD